MEILGNTLDGKIIIIVSQEELDDIQKGKRVTTADYTKTEAYQQLRATALRGISWPGWFRDLFEQGEFDGSIDQLKTLIEADKPLLYTTERIRLSKKSIQKIYQALLSATANE